MADESTGFVPDPDVPELFPELPRGRHAAPDVVCVERADAEFCAGVLADLGGAIGEEGQSVLRRLSASLGAPQPRSALPPSVHPSGTPDGLTGAYSATTTGDDE